MEEVAAWLADNGLSEYASSFEAEGYDDLQLLGELSTDELDELAAATHMKRGHALKLKKRVPASTHGAAGEADGGLAALAAQVELQAAQICELQANLGQLTVALPANRTAAEPRKSGSKKGEGMKKGFLSAPKKSSKQPPPEPVEVPELEPADESSEIDLEIPDQFRCSITQELFKCPVITSDGHSYEREAISKWLSTNNTSPLTGKPLADKVC